MNNENCRSCEIGYVCKYTPVELLTALGGTPRLLNDEVEDFDYAQRVSHPNLCSHMKALLETLHSGKLQQMLLTTCCDSGRRACDILQNEATQRVRDTARTMADEPFLFLLDLPHLHTAAAKQQYKGELLRLIQAYRTVTGKAFDEDAFRSACAKTAAMSPARNLPPKYIGVLGARVSEGLLTELQAHAPIPVINLTCNSLRTIAQPPETCRGDLDGLMTWYADQLLSQLPCMRMADINRRDDLLALPGLCGVIYHTVKFCDYYGGTYETIRQQTKLPLLKIETDFTSQSLGQLSTRIDGFLESMDLRPSSNRDGQSGGAESARVRNTAQSASHPYQQGANSQANQSVKSPATDAAFYVGIDSGSTTTNVAVLDAQGQLIDSAIVRTGAKAQRGAEKAFASLSVPQENIAYIVATGYGRSNISFADEAITEITCHARGAFALAPNARTIIDIGGQDCKAIALDERGNVKNFAMNDKCAAGTGRFLENMAKVLETDLDGMSTVGLTWREDLTISSMCTVFAESEVVSLIADNKSIGDIVHGLNKSVAAKALTLVNRVGAESRYMMTGGGARNQGVVQCIEALLGEKLIVPETPDLCGAIGAALFALERGKQ